jgi:membrane dipeptidase
MTKTRTCNKLPTLLKIAQIALLFSIIIAASCRDKQPPAAGQSASSAARRSTKPLDETESLDEASRLHQAAIVIDAHADTIQAVLAGRDLARRNTAGQIDIPRMRAGGLDAEFFAIFVDPIYQGERSIQRTNNIIAAIEQTCAANRQDLALARTAQDIEAAVNNGRIAILMGIEGGQAINNNLAALDQFYQRGVRYMGLTWSNTNDWADAAGDVERHHGLTEFGRQVVREMNRIGMLVDVSHASDKTFYDVLATSTKPVIASHSSCRALTNHARNMTDDMLRALAKQGGVCCINFYSEFIDESYRARQSKYPKPGQAPRADQFNGDLDRWAIARFQRFVEPSKNPPPPFDSLINHIDHAVKIAGIDHVGLGSDFDGVDALPQGMEDAAKLPNITKALLARGYSPEDIKKILGGNLLRVLRAAQQ